MDSKSTIFMDKNGKDTKNTRHIYRRVHFVRNGENCKMHKINWCKGCLQSADIATKNVGENDFNPIIKSIMLRLDNRDRIIVQEGWYDTYRIVYITRVMYD